MGVIHVDFRPISVAFNFRIFFVTFLSSSTPPPPPTRTGSVRQLNHEMKSASLGRKQNPSELDYFDKPLPDEPEKSNKRSALNRGIFDLSNFFDRNLF